MGSGHIFFDQSYHGNMLLIGNGDSIFRETRLVNMEETSMKRPFFSTHEELYYDEEYYDEQLPEKKRRLTAEQVHLLEKSFEIENKLEPERKTDLAKKLGLQPRQVAIWFQNRRARYKTKQLERDYDDLKFSYDSLMINCDLILKENEKLKAEVVSMRKKLHDQEAALDHKSSQLRVEDFHASALIQLNSKMEDGLSTGSVTSAVVDQLLDSGDSYSPNNDYLACMAAVDDVGSDNGGNYFSNVFVPAEQQHHQEEAESPGWSIWS